jgi:hypothetical protein
MKQAGVHRVRASAARLWVCVLLAGACGGDDAGPSRRWDCFEYRNACGCIALGPSDSVASSGREVARCESYACCYLTGSGTDASCDCDQSTACDSEVESRRDAERVASCPPPAEQEPVRCAAEGENCRASYLSEQRLEGCCSGLLCEPNDEGVPLCQRGSAAEITLSRQCNQATYAEDVALELLDEVQSADGPVRIDNVNVGDPFTVGPGGCLVSTQIKLGTCELQLGPERDASGALLVTSTTSNACRASRLGERVSGNATFEGVSCKEGRCFAGTFELSLTSTLETEAPATIPVLTGMPFRIGGTLCPANVASASSCGD